MLDRTKGFPPDPGKPVETFPMSPTDRRHMAFKLEQSKDNTRAPFLAKHFRFLTEHIQGKINNGAARIKGP
jgi:hypothetical protein